MGLGFLCCGLCYLDLHRYQARNDECVDLANCCDTEWPMGVVALVDGEKEEA